MKRIGILTAGDGSLNGMHPLAGCLPVVLATKTIANDLGLNYRNKPDERLRDPQQPYHSRNTDMSKRIRYLDANHASH